jgi:hypothetical protein
MFIPKCRRKTTVGRDEELIRNIRNQEKRDWRLDQLNLWHQWATFRSPKPGAVALASQDSHFERFKNLKARGSARDRYFKGVEITLLSPTPDAAKAQSYFERAIVVARAANEIIGTARGDEHDAALARSRQARR